MPKLEPASCKARSRKGKFGRHKLEDVMSVIDFFEYLASNDDTVELAHELADVWVARQMAQVFEPAA
jgi:hypothetical protein